MKTSHGITSLILYSKSCSCLISTFLIANDVENIWLPADICSSVIEQLYREKLSYRFYDVRRSWTDCQHDEYDLPKLHENDWLLISDMFNFNNYTVKRNINCNIILDLAHCSFKKLVEANKIFGRISNLKLTCISFGKGKYHRLDGGGGMGFTTDCAYDPHYTDLYIQSDKYTLKNIPEHILGLSQYSPKSTRLVLSGDDFSNECIQGLRKSGFDISDGLYNHLSQKRSNEYYLWKAVN
jgi:hypothetical protein